MREEESLKRREEEVLKDTKFNEEILQDSNEVQKEVSQRRRQQELPYSGHQLEDGTINYVEPLVPLTPLTRINQLDEIDSLRKIKSMQGIENLDRVANLRPLEELLPIQSMREILSMRELTPEQAAKLERWQDERNRQRQDYAGTRGW